MITPASHSETEAVNDASATTRPRILFALPGLHKVCRGAEVAFESIAYELVRQNLCDVTLIGAGESRADSGYDFAHAGCVSRTRFEHWPALPVLRRETDWEELTFVPSLWRRFNPDAHDLTVTCSYPFTNWILRARKKGGSRLPHVFVTQNGDFPVHANQNHHRFFGCDGLVCTNPEYYERNRENWNATLIPNGVDPERFCPGPAAHGQFDLPDELPIVLMVSALIPSKRILEGIQAVAELDGVRLVIAGDGPMRQQVIDAGQAQMGERFSHLRLPRESMPALYRCASAFLHMSLDEPSANAYIEAMATGLPIVTHDRLVTRWTCESTAVLTDAESADAVRRSLEEAINETDPRRVEARRDLVDRRFSWARLAQDYAQFFDDVIRQYQHG